MKRLGPKDFRPLRNFKWRDELQRAFSWPYQVPIVLVSFAMAGFNQDIDRVEQLLCNFDHNVAPLTGLDTEQTIKVSTIRELAKTVGSSDQLKTAIYYSFTLRQNLLKMLTDKNLPEDARQNIASIFCDVAQIPKIQENMMKENYIDILNALKQLSKDPQTLKTQKKLVQTIAALASDEKNHEKLAKSRRCWNFRESSHN